MDIIDSNSVEYPVKIKKILGKKAPEKLSYSGNLDLFNFRGVGFCGSRKASEKGLLTAGDCAEVIVENNINVVSGYASGVDMQAHIAALKSGGNTIIVLPEGIDHFRIKKVIRDYWDWGRVLVISQFEPNASWQAYRAMERNKIIIALSDAMVVIEAGEKGGTFNAGITTLKFGLPLYVANYEDMELNAPGNKMLIEKGGKKLGRNKTTLKPNFDALFHAIKNNELIKPEQKSLF